MALLFFITGIGIAFMLVCYALIQSRLKSSQFLHQTQALALDLNRLQESYLLLQQELINTQSQLRHASEDATTRLLGWQLFEDRLTQSIKESQRYQLTMGILLIDIDDFNVINEALNYEVGNALLFEVGQRVEACVRQVDSVSRLSKDTFVVLLTQLAKPETAAIVAQRILQALAQPFSIKDRELHITVSVGIAIYPHDGEDTQTLLRSGHHALRLAKEKGHHLYQFYEEGMHVCSRRELTLYTDLSKESVLTDFVLYYQPVINTENETMVGVDALLHWQHAEFGLIEPQEVWGLIERQRKTNAVSEWLLHHACKQFQHWQSLGMNPGLIGIPVSMKQLENSHFIYRLQQCLQELQFNPECLLLVVRESKESISAEAMEKAFNMLSYLGVKIAIDHFGSGSFSFFQLKKLAIHAIKLDSSLISDVHLKDNHKAKALMKALVFLARTLSIQIIAQGVACEAQMAMLKELGCVQMQGPFFGQLLCEQEVAIKLSSIAHS